MTTPAGPATAMSPFDAATYVYPWDVIGDPAAPERIAALGVGHVTLAALYHATRALTPQHPAHRVVVADNTAVYLPLDESRWSGAALRPPQQTRLAGQRDAFGTAANALSAVGLRSHAWVVVNHIDPHPGTGYARLAPTVVNAYGDSYSWALCPARSEVRDYAVRMAGQVAAHENVAGIEFEAAGWYGFDHLHAHDKVSGVSLDQAEQFLFSLCFCEACDAEYRRCGIDPAELRATVRAALDRVFTGETGRAAESSGTTGDMSEREKINALLGSQSASAVLAMRGTVAGRLRAEMVAAVRRLRPESDFPVVFHADPHPHRSTAFTGLDPATLPGGADGVVLNCWADAGAAAESVDATVKSGREGLRVLAGMLAVAGMGATPERAAAILDAVRRSGARGIRIYHAGIAGSADLDLIRELVTAARLKG